MPQHKSEAVEKQNNSTTTAAATGRLDRSGTITNKQKHAQSSWMESFSRNRAGPLNNSSRERERSSRAIVLVTRRGLVQHRMSSSSSAAATKNKIIKKSRKKGGAVQQFPFQRAATAANPNSTTGRNSCGISFCLLLHSLTSKKKSTQWTQQKNVDQNRY